MFHSSDNLRSNKISDYVKYLKLDTQIVLESGFAFDDCVIAYETYGQLNVEKNNAILICHAISGDSHVSKHDDNDADGWWDIMVGPGLYIDTNKYFVISSNILGGCMGTTGPNHINEKTGDYWGSDFPEISVSDMVLVQSKLIEYLEIDKLLCVIGGSLGAYQSIEWGVRFPDKLHSVISLAGGPRLTSQGIAFDIIGRNAIRRDPYFNDGQYYKQSEGPNTGLALARMLGHITYLSEESMSEKFDHDRYDPKDVDTDFEKEFSVGSYLAYQGDKFVERFDPNSYITLSKAMDKFDLGKNSSEISVNLTGKNLKWFLMSFTSDWLFPSSLSEELTRALIIAKEEVSYIEIPSNCGHDAFLLDDDIKYYGNYVNNFIENIANDLNVIKNQEYHPDRKISERQDYNIILEFLDNSKRIIDLGCGDGDLLYEIKKIGNANKILGIDNNLESLLNASKKGIPVLGLDLNNDLHLINDNQFDVAILSLTLQSIIEVETVLLEICRISSKVILSFPNFAYEPLRKMLYEEGRAPKHTGVLKYEWYNSPNKRYMSILDFEEFCNIKNFNIINSKYLNTDQNKFISENYNFNADLGIFMISKDN